MIKKRYEVIYSTEECAHINTWHFNTFEDAVNFTMNLWKEVEPTFEDWMDCLVIKDTADVKDGFPKRWFIEDLLNPEKEIENFDDNEHWVELRDIVDYF